MTGWGLAMGRVACRVCLLILLSAVWLSAGSTAAAAATVEKQGYIPMADGTQLEYTVDLPADTGRFPVALVYDGYWLRKKMETAPPRSRPSAAWATDSVRWTE